MYDGKVRWNLMFRSHDGINVGGKAQKGKLQEAKYYEAEILGGDASEGSTHVLRLNISTK